MRLIHVLVAVSLLLTVPVFCDGSDGDPCLFRLHAVYPTEGFEGFALMNYGRTADIKGYSVTDGEGTVTFNESIVLSQFEVVYFCKSAVPSWFGADKVILYGERGVTMKGFALADSGDDIYLFKGDQLVDTFVYGDGKAKNGGWNGEAFQKIAKKHIAVRTSIMDTDSSADWTLTTPGRSGFRNDSEYDATVTPLSFPDDQAPLFKALQDATFRVDISVYLISHPKVVSSLLRSLNSGVNVRILIEGSPAGGVTSLEIKAMRTLTNAGADVRVMKQTDGYRGYSYTHAKYAVVDDDTVIITSENWQEGSFDSNRGWGTVIRSEGYASYMRAVFESDFYRTYDVQRFDAVFPTSETMAFDRYVPVTTETVSYEAKVRPVISPDNSYDTMRSFILSANDRVYSQQLDVEYHWLFGNDNPLSWMRAVSGRTDCRLMVDVTFDDRNDGDPKDGYGVMDSLSGSDILTSEPAFSGLSHNKGVIVDDRVWIGSVNWTVNSFTENREAAVIIDSRDVTEYYVSLFMSDWGVGTKTSEGPKIDVQNRGQMFMLTAECGSNCRCTWDLDGDGIFETEGRKVLKEFPGGHHTVALSVDDGEDIQIITAEFTSEVQGTGDIIPMKYYPIIIICAAVLCLNAIRWVRRKHVPDKGFQRRGY